MNRLFCAVYRAIHTRFHGVEIVAHDILRGPYEFVFGPLHHSLLILSSSSEVDAGVKQKTATMTALLYALTELHYPALIGANSSDCP